MIKNESKEVSLKKMKRGATGLLLLMVFVYIAAKHGEQTYAWLGYFRAFAEAAMVGAFADWFAVTALFRHPFGVSWLRPIPFIGPLIYNHTAIIPNNKDRIGESLGDFVEGHFLTPEAVRERLEAEDIAGRSAAWLANPDNSSFIVDEFCSFLPRILDAIDDKDIRRFIRENITSAVRSIEIAPLAGNFLDTLTSNNKHQALFDEGLRLVNRLFEDYKPDLGRKITDETPWYLEILGVDTAIYNKVVKGIRETLRQVADNPDHELRKRFNEATLLFIENLKSSPAYKARGEAFKEDILLHPAVQQYLENVWVDMKAMVLDDIKKSDSVIRGRLKEAVTAIGRGLLRDEAVRQKINVWIQNAVIYTVSSHRNAISSLISSQVKKWDAKTLTGTLELQIGKDLQYIRINGTLVGGFVGLIIYLLSKLI